MKRFSRFIDEHPIVSFIGYLLCYQVISWLVLEVFNPICSSFILSKRQNTVVSCDWGVPAPFEWFLNVFFGWGPILGPFISAIILSGLYILFWKSWFSRLSKTDEKIVKPITPYGTLAKHKEVLLASGAAEKDADRVVAQYRE
ncbi:hypothetical protein M0C34_01350 [Agarivorans sp. TSD2052]|uniref:hypothetical protein n=1 Tax=Agarivorans sp. TSD2052 TaxID=2937286 RepID=UPI00200F83F0|nr:hypothetical protein [Agarivorans sp. TSD2052]UPW18950.1 hypothetical protein M0C34_01350 [Agarivorans sp. TSD2052]